MNTTLRIDEKTLSKLKLLKKVSGSKSYQEDIEKLVHDKLKETHAYTQDGYLPAGTVVQDNKGTPLVIKTVTSDRVIFDDMSYMFNGGSACWELSKVVDKLVNHNERILP